MKTAITTIILIFLLASFALYNATSYNYTVYSKDKTLLYDNVKIVSSKGNQIIILTAKGEQKLLNKSLVILVKK